MENYRKDQETSTFYVCRDMIYQVSRCACKCHISKNGIYSAPCKQTNRKHMTIFTILVWPAFFFSFIFFSYQTILLSLTLLNLPTPTKRCRCSLSLVSYSEFINESASFHAINAFPLKFCRCLHTRLLHLKVSRCVRGPSVCRLKRTQGFVLAYFYFIIFFAMRENGCCSHIT